METEILPAKTAGYTRPSHAITIMMALLVMIWLLFAIVGHWKTFDWSKKVVAIALVFTLFISPPLRPRWSIFKYLEKRESDPDYLKWDTYMFLLLVLMLFA